MRSLFVKFFLAFWLVIVLIIGAAAIGGFLYAERLQETIDDFEAGDSMQAASAALEQGGKAALARWLKGLPRDDGVIVFIVDESGSDIAGRRMPFGVERMLERHQARSLRAPGETDGPRNLRRSRLLPQLVGPDGSVYTMLVAPARHPEAFWSSQDMRFWLLAVAVLTSGVVSYALAAAFSRPVRRLREATVSLANGNLDARVAESVGKRRDDLGMLGRDFDTMAEKLQRAAAQQTELSRNISHELRSPLARMRVAVELARRKAGDLPEFERLDADAERLDALIGQILSYTRLDADAERTGAPVDLADVLSEVVENVNFECGDARVRIEPAISGGVNIRGLRGALVSAIENVVRNAVRHSPADSGVIVSLSQSTDGVHIDVADRGPGVSDEDLPRLFEPFFRTRESAEQDGNGGTGLGLAIARRAVELQHGIIEARNRNGGGLTVRISLPGPA